MAHSFVVPSLASLGTKICIIGPSNSGKSTLAQKLGQKLNLAICHLDQLAHLEHTNWQRRPDTDFVAEHDAFIQNENWVMDGNYSICMPQRFARASAIIWLDPPLIGFLGRYILRSLANNDQRAGNLTGAKVQFSLQLIKYTFFNYPKNRQKYNGLLQASHKPLIKIKSMSELNKYYAAWGIER